MDDDKLKMLKDIITKIERDNGKGSIIMLGDSAHDSSIESISTGSISLDIALGVGGVPKGRIIEVYGPESSGKTTIALNIIAEVQKKGGIAAFIDVENAVATIDKAKRKYQISFNRRTAKERCHGAQFLGRQRIFEQRPICS